MKRIVILLALILSAANVYAEGQEKECPMPPAPPASKELALIKLLEGRWVGSGMEKEGKGEEAVVEYRVTSGGSAVEEKLGPGTPREMVSMYHDVKGKLAMTHYCMLGNSPELELKSADPGKIVLGESAASQALLGGQMRMQGLTLEQPDKDTLIQTWTGQDSEGKPQPPTILKFKRV